MCKQGVSLSGVWWSEALEHAVRPMQGIDQRDVASMCQDSQPPARRGDSVFTMVGVRQCPVLLSAIVSSQHTRVWLRSTCIRCHKAMHRDMCIAKDNRTLVLLGIAWFFLMWTALPYDTDWNRSNPPDMSSAAWHWHCWCRLNSFLKEIIILLWRYDEFFTPKQRNNNCWLLLSLFRVRVIFE